MVDSILGFAGQALLSSFFIFHGFLTMRNFHAHELGYELHFHVHVEWFNGWTSYVVWFAVPKHHQEPKWGTLLLILTRGRQPGAVKSRLVQCSTWFRVGTTTSDLPSAHQILLEPPTPMAVPIIPVPSKGSVAAWSIQIWVWINTY